MKKALAIDVGGTKVYNTIIDEKGKIIADVEKHHTPKTFDGIKNLFEEIIKRYENDVDIIAFATAGAVNNTNDGILGSTGNIVKDYPKVNFKALSKKPVFVENDANAAAWAEHIIGSSKGMPYSVMLTLGTGVGGGLIFDNKLYKGKSGTAGEMHFKMRTDNHRKCTCGAWDCFEVYASGSGLKRTAEEITGNPDVTTYDVIEKVKEKLGDADKAASNYKVLEQFKDDKLIKSFLQWQDDILAGLIGIADMLDPDVIVLSGSMADFVDFKYLEDKANREILTQPFKLVKASAGNYSGMIGAALLALGVK